MQSLEVFQGRFVNMHPPKAEAALPSFLLCDTYAAALLWDVQGTSPIIRLWKSEGLLL